MWFDGKNKEQEKKQKTAVAVAYEPGDAAPKILAAGKGEDVVAEILVFVDDMDKMKAKLSRAGLL